QDQVAQDELYRFALPYYNNLKDGLFASNFKTPFKMPSVGKNGNGVEEEEEVYLNEIRLENFNGVEKSTPSDSPAANHLVMLHGYAASNGWWFKNLDELIKRGVNSKIHVLDMLGFGLSSRPNIKYKHDKKSLFELEFDNSNLTHHKQVHKSLYLPDTYTIDKSELKNYLKGQYELIDEVESIYVESLESWRSATGLAKFDLLAHSLGGYVALAYALKYPERINKLILVSPGGIERSPFAISNPEYKLLDDESSNSGKKIEFKTSNWPGHYGFLGRYPTLKESFKWAWNNRWSAFTFLRLSGPIGPKALSLRNVNKLTRSGSINNWKEIDLFIKYIYHVSIKPSFSETSIMRIFDASVVGRYPMLDRINQLRVNKTLWIYGEHDFMFNDCGKAAVDILKSNNKDAKFEVVSNAGHNLYLDNSKEFNDKVLNFLDWK
ncbi:hypothetical protein CANARDRAFT_187663, partial [[Candida] arabinofermentans NRRL YB-2248]